MTPKCVCGNANAELIVPAGAQTIDKMIPFVDTQKAPSPIGAGSRGIAHAKLSTKGLRTQSREDSGRKG